MGPQTTTADVIYCKIANASATAMASFLEVAKKWGIFAAFTTGLVLFNIFCIKTLYNSQENLNEFVRDKLVTQIAKSDSNSILILNELKESAEVREDLKEVIENNTQAYQEFKEVVRSATSFHQTSQLGDKHE